ncbi:MAG: DUF4054 domain-containing protein [Leptolyngbyaceae cyanobacterium]
MADPLTSNFCYDESVIAQVIAEVECILPASRWAKQCTSCDRRELAIKYLTAHRLTVLNQTQALNSSASGQATGLISGQISSISASQGNQSVSFSPVSGDTVGAGWLAEGQTPTFWWNLFLGIMGTRQVALGFTI